MYISSLEEILGPDVQRLKALDLVIKKNVIGIQKKDQIHNLSYNSQPERLTR